MKTVILILFTCFVFVAKMYAQSTAVTLYVLESKDKTWQGIKLGDKNHNKLSLASKLLQANKDSKLQAYHYDSQNNTKIVAIKYSQVAKNMELPTDNKDEQVIEPLQKSKEEKDATQNLDFMVDNMSNYYLNDIKGLQIFDIKGEKYFALILPANKRPENKDFTIAMYKISDVEKALKYKIHFEYLNCEVCNFENDKNSAMYFYANPLMQEYLYKEFRNE